MYIHTSYSPTFALLARLIVCHSSYGPGVSTTAFLQISTASDKTGYVVDNLRITDDDDDDDDDEWTAEAGKPKSLDPEERFAEKLKRTSAKSRRRNPGERGDPVLNSFF